jgi:hypothetical protein
MRSRRGDRAARVYLRDLKRDSPSTRVLVEIPTYLYDQEDLRPSQTLVRLKDLWNRRRVMRYLNRIVTVSQDETIWGVPTIRVANGVDVEAIPMASPRGHSDGTINLIALGILVQSHGFDRLLTGMRRYYDRGGSQSTCVHAVGDGEALAELRRIAAASVLAGRVVFHGALTGSSLDSLMDHVGIGVCGLAMHRIGISPGNSPKSREYLVRGLPIIYAGDFGVVPRNLELACRFESTDQPNDTRKILDSFDHLSARYAPSEIRRNVRRCALVTIDVRRTMERVVDYLASINGAVYVSADQ